jgi:hypothetical protein
MGSSIIGWFIFNHLMISCIISHCPILQLSQNYNFYKDKHQPSKWCNQLAPLIMIVLPTFNEQTSQSTWQDLAITTYIYKFLNDSAKWQCNTKRHVHEPKCNDQLSQHKWTFFWWHMSCIKLQPLSMVFIIPKTYVHLIIIHFNPNISQTLFFSNLSYNTCIYNMTIANSNMENGKT